MPKEMVVTTWHPDTCGCVVAYEWERDSPEDTRVHTAVKTQHTKTCQHHKAHDNDHVKHHAVVLEENQRKNFAVHHLVDNHMTDADHTHVQWQYDNDRILHLKALKPTHGNPQASVNQKFGAGKVLVD